MLWWLGALLFFALLIIPIVLLLESPLLVLGIVFFLVVVKWWSERKEDERFHKACFHHRPGTNLFVSKTFPSSSSSSPPSSSSSPPSSSSSPPSSSSSPTKHTVFLHGMLGSSRFWNQTTQNLSNDEGIGCIAPDLLGFGRSPWPSGPHNYTIDEHCSWLLRDTLPPPPPENDDKGKEEEEVHLVGHSLGGVMALEMGSRLPPHLKLASVTVVSMPYFQTQQEAEKALFNSPIPYLFITWPKATWVLCSLLCQQRWFWSFPISSIISLVTLPFPKYHVPYEIIEDFFLHSCESATATMKHCVLSHNISLAAEEVRKRGGKIHVVHGDDDTTTSATNAKMFADEFGDSYHGVRGAKHLLPLHAPKVLCGILREGVEGTIEPGTKREYECE